MKFLTGHDELLTTIDDVVERIKQFMDQDKTSEYEISIGSDSHSFSRATKYVTVVVVHQIGKGGILFRKNTYVKGRKPALYEKLMKETTLTIDIASLIIPKIQELVKTGGYRIPNIFADGDVNIKESEPSTPYGGVVEGMFKAFGLNGRIKPNAIAATYVADYFC